jgi:hypothetical protein
LNMFQTPAVLQFSQGASHVFDEQVLLLPTPAKRRLFSGPFRWNIYHHVYRVFVDTCDSMLLSINRCHNTITHGIHERLECYLLQDNAETAA